MKRVYILSIEEVEELKDIKDKILADVDILEDLSKSLNSKQIHNEVKSYILDLLEMIEVHCWNIGRILDD